MGTLAARLRRLRRASARSIGPRALELMHRSTEELRRSGLADRALGEGDIAPDFALQNSEATTRQLSRLAARGPVVLSFFRGHWCPFCSAELGALERSLDEIRAAGGDLFTVSPQLQTHSRALRRRRGLRFEILFDPGGEVSARFGLRVELPADLVEAYRDLGIDLEASNGARSWRLPIPARYVVDEERVIRYARIDPDPTRRAEPAEVVAALRLLRP